MIKSWTYSVGIEITGFLFAGGHTLRLGRCLLFFVRIDSLGGHQQVVEKEKDMK